MRKNILWLGVVHCGSICIRVQSVVRNVMNKKSQHRGMVCAQTLGQILRSKPYTQITMTQSGVKMIDYPCGSKRRWLFLDKAWKPLSLTLLFWEMRSADSRMTSFLEICSDLSISRPLVNISLRAMYAAVSLTLDSCVPESPVANSWLWVSRVKPCGRMWGIRHSIKTGIT